MSYALLKRIPSDAVAGAEADRVSVTDGAMTYGLSFELVGDMNGIKRLEPEWNDLFRAHGKPEQVFQSPTWCRMWCEVYLSPEHARSPRLAIVTGRIGGRLMMVIPLVVERHLGLKLLVCLGDPVSQYGDVLAAPEAAGAAELAAGLRFAMAATSADVAFLRKVRDGSLASAALLELSSTIVATEEAPFVDLTLGSFGKDGSLQLPGLRRTKNRRRQLRRLEELGSVEFATLTAGPAAADAAALAIALKRDWLKRKGQLSRALHDSRFSSFFRLAADGRGQPTPVIVSTLKSCGEIAAVQIELVAGDQRMLHMSVYHPRFERLGVGGLLLEYSLKVAVRERASRYDLLPPGYEYKFEFATASAKVHDHVVVRTLRGRLYATTVLAMRRRAKRLLERLPMGSRAAVGRLTGFLRG